MGALLNGPAHSTGAFTALLDAVASSGEAQWLIEPEAGRLVVASASGALRTGLPAAAMPASLDLAMPAMIRLREFARSGAGNEEQRTALVFWTRAGAARIVALVRRIETESGTLLLVRAEGTAAAPDEPPQDSVPPTPPADESQPPPPAAETPPPRDAPPPRTDAETLQEIARRILNGTPPPASEPHHTSPAPQPEPAPAETTAAGRYAVSVATALGTVIAKHPGAPEPAPLASPEPPAPLPEAEPDPASTPAETSRAGAPAQAESQLDPSQKASLAHELKSPLSAIAAAAEMMRDERLGPLSAERYREYAASIHDTARHALAVVDRILAGSATDQERGAFEFESLDLNALAMEMVRAFAPMIRASGQEIETELAPGEARVMADATSMRQIVSNLLVNARKFTAAGGRIVLATRSPPEGPVQIEVRDTGRGMTETEIAASGRGSGTPASREGGGYGLGLPLVRQLAEANGARFEIVSRPGEGTRAILSFAKNRLILV